MAGYTNEGVNIKEARRIIDEAVYNTGYEKYYSKRPPKGMSLEEKKRKVDSRDRERKQY